MWGRYRPDIARYRLLVDIDYRDNLSPIKLSSPTLIGTTPQTLRDEAIGGGVGWLRRGSRALEGYQDQDGQQLGWRRSEFSLVTSRPLHSVISPSSHCCLTVFHHSARIAPDSRPPGTPRVPPMLPHLEIHRVTPGSCVS